EPNPEGLRDLDGRRAAQRPDLQARPGDEVVRSAGLALSPRACPARLPHGPCASAAWPADTPPPGRLAPLPVRVAHGWLSAHGAASRGPDTEPIPRSPGQPA